jgi:NADH pyrophosphatase NudC (nudix superfamily)
LFIINVEGAVVKDNKWLLIQRGFKEEHAGGTLSLVGGKVDNEGSATEIIERTVKREIYEEVGMTVKDILKFVYSSSFVTASSSLVVNIVFVCEWESGEAYCKSQDEVENVYWMTHEEIVNHAQCPPWTKESRIGLIAYG